MTYYVDGPLWSSAFAVPSTIVDQHLKLCGGASLKVLLLLLRRGGDADLGEIASFLNLPAADVQDAINYWVHLGVLRQTQESDAVRPSAPAPAPAAAVLSYTEEKDKPEKASPALSPTPAMPMERRRLSTREINEMGKQDQNIAYLLQEAQGVLGKPLTPVSTDTIVALYSYYGMQPDLILMLLQYCISMGKDNMRYVEKVAASWIEAGIDTHEKAEKEILRATRRQGAEEQVRRLMGIYDRALVSSEREYIRCWTEDMNCSMELIGLAYERTIEQKGKLSFAYLNGILQNWRSKGITTVKQAREEILQNAGKWKREKAPAPAKSAASYDMEELERLTYGTKE
ncbi:MAG: DnaD domain protein [Oscillospiraceae bacterium]|jgi:DnaD/phage-associated family protein